ncbi:alpha/beta hydrolase [Agromyces sp. MMS24-JH15]|uniref:alpha/beta hydrolase n=1 Tax=Agromyces sp. MMS24-JH15 TaxID=3243765 RepID=UPI00374995F1
MRSSKRSSLIVALLVFGLALTGCAESSAEGRQPDVTATPAPTPTATVAAGRHRDIQYREVDGQPLLLDACIPEGDGPVAAIVLVHGGGFVAGDRTSLGGLCGDLAKAGYAAFSIDYRLAPANVYPSQVEDLTAAVEWLRQPEQVATYGIDPARIGVVGSSAGGILAQSIGTAGEGDRTTGSRVAAVVSLSGASVFTEQALQLGTPTKEGAAMILSYLHCKPTAPDACPNAAPASPITAIDPTDPPFLMYNSTQEIVPIEQARAMRDALAAAGVPITLVEVPGTSHGVDILRTEGQGQLLDFLAATLGAPVQG